MPRFLAAVLLLHALGRADTERRYEEQHSPTSIKTTFKTQMVCQDMFSKFKKILEPRTLLVDQKKMEEVKKYCIRELGDAEQCATFIDKFQNDYKKAMTHENKTKYPFSPKFKKACKDAFENPTSRSSAAPGLQRLKRSASAVGTLPPLSTSVSASSPASDPSSPSPAPKLTRAASGSALRAVRERHNEDAGFGTSESKFVSRMRGMRANSSSRLAPSSRAGTGAKGAGPEARISAKDVIKKKLKVDKQSVQERMNALATACGNSKDNPPCILNNVCSLDDLDVTVGGRPAKVQEALMSCREIHKGTYALMVFDKSQFEDEEKVNLIINLVIKPELIAAKIELVASSRCSTSGTELLQWIEHFVRDILFTGKPPSLFLDDDARDTKTGLVIRYSYPLMKLIEKDPKDHSVGPGNFKSWYESKGFEWVGTRSMGTEHSFLNTELAQLKGRIVTSEDWVALKKDVLDMPFPTFRSALTCAACSIRLEQELQAKLDDDVSSKTLFDFMVRLYKEKTEQKQLKPVVQLLLQMVLTDVWLKWFLNNIDAIRDRKDYSYCAMASMKIAPEALKKNKCSAADYDSLAKEKVILTQLRLLGDSYDKIGEFRKILK